MPKFTSKAATQAANVASNVDTKKPYGQLVFNVVVVVILLALLVGTGVYLFNIRREVLFTLLNPNSVSVCLDGYQGEHSEADRRFEMKQRGELISPMPLEMEIKEYGQE